MTKRTQSARCCLIAFLFCTALALVHPSAAEVREWVGHDGDNANWSRAANWNPPGAPQNGDLLVFRIIEGSPQQVRQTYNDLIDLQVTGVRYCGAQLGMGPTWSIDGNELTLLGDVAYTNSCGGTYSFFFNCPLKIGASLRIEMYSGLMILRGNINLNGHDLTLVSGDEMIVSGQITGTGNVRVNGVSVSGESSVRFNGPVGNTFSGKLIVTARYYIGRVIFDKQSGVVVNDALWIDQFDAICELARPHQIGDNADMVIIGGGQLLLNGHTETIGSLCFSNSVWDRAPSLVDTGGSTLSVLGNITAINNATGVVPIIRGKLGLPDVAADARTKTTLTSTSPRRQRTVSSISSQPISRASATNRSHVNQQTLQGR